eukprot:s280_g15.t1
MSLLRKRWGDESLARLLLEQHLVARSSELEALAPEFSMGTEVYPSSLLPMGAGEFESPERRLRNLGWASFAEPGSLGLALAAGAVSDGVPWGMEQFFKLVKHTTSSDVLLGRPGIFPLPVVFQERGCASIDDGAAAVQAWLNLLCLALNQLAGCKKKPPTHRKSAQVTRVLEALENRVRRFLRLFSPLSLDPLSVWKDLKEKKVSYDGEEFAEPGELTLEQILKSLPPEGHGGSVDLVPLLVGRARFLVENPREVLLPPEEKEPGPNIGRVHIKKGEELAVWQLLEARGVITWLPLEEIHCDSGGAYLSGLFGVPKSGRFTDSGLPLLRVIMNLKPINRALRIIQGDIAELPCAGKWMQLVLEEGECLEISQADMSSAFYLFSLPKAWWPMLGFNAKFKASALGRPGSGTFVPCCRVLPMGWASSVGLMQMASRELISRINIQGPEELRQQLRAPPWFVDTLLRDSSKQFWQVYLDNFMTAELVAPGGTGGSSQQLHHEAVQAWNQQGVLCADDKHVIAAPSAIELGVDLNGQEGLVGCGPERIHKLLVATLLLLGHKQPRAKWVQVILGRWIFLLQYRRPAMSVLSKCWNFFKKGEDKRRWWPVVQFELSNLVALIPLLHSDLRCGFSNQVTCSDASSWGGAVALSQTLTSAGEDLCSRLSEPRFEPVDACVLVISAFNGIGGAFRGYDLSGIRPAGLISIECDRAARRVTRKAWPHVEEVADILEVDRAMVKDWANRYPRISQVHIIGGFPCVHLLSARAGRANLQGEGSRLFWNLVDLIQWVKEIFEPTAAVRFLVENVRSMDVAARDEISRVLRVEPLALCPSDILPYNRPRLAWYSGEVEETAGIDLLKQVGHTVVIMHGNAPPAETWLMPGWEPCNPNTPFATFMKAIKRRRPPPVPAGINRCDQDCLARWESDEFRFPPYQYRLENLVQNSTGELRYLCAAERERLLGFGQDHTLFAVAANSVKGEEIAFEDKRLSLCGDSFSMLSFGWIISQMCKAWVPPRSPQQIVDRFGLASGCGLAADVPAPLALQPRYGGLPNSNHSSQRLVAHLSRHVNHTGSDVSLAERSAARQGISLRGLGISLKTELRYRAAMAGLITVLEQAHCMDDLDPLCEEWVEHHWEVGTPLGTIGDALCGLHYFWPQVKGQLRGSWKLYKNWRRIELPQRAPPLPREMCRALIGWFLSQEQATMAFLLALGFHAFLRTGELLNLCNGDISFSRDKGVVVIRKSKSGLRFNMDESVALYDTTLARLWELHALAGSSTDQDPIWSGSGTLFRKKLYAGFTALHLDTLNFQAYSIRRGGATHAFATSMALDRVILRGRRYFQSWFLIDLLVLTMDASIILVETFGSFSENESTTLSPFHSARFLRALRLLRLLRLMRVAKLQQEMMVLANRFLTTHTFMLMKVVAGVCMLLLINHIIACSWYGIGTWEFEGRSWLARLEIPQNDFAESYAASMHWALTQFTPATNNIAPDNAMERFFALGVVVFAIGIFSSFITQITTTMSSLRMARSEQNQKRAKLLQFFSERGLSVGLFGKVQQALQQEGHFEVRLKEPDVMLIQKIPERLKMQLHEEMFRNNLLSLNIWPSSTKDNEYFLATICHHAMQDHSAVPGQDVFLPGTDCHDVYVIESGSMGYVTVAGDLIGDFTSVQGGLCLPCLWCEWTHRGRLAATMGICYYARLRCDQFCTIVQKFGGPLFQFLQIFGIFLVSEIEAMDQQGVEVTDVNLDEELLKGFGRRAERFARMQKPGMSGNHTIAFQHTQTQSKLSSSRRLERKVEKIDEVLLGEAPEQPPEQPAAPALASQASQVAISIEPPRWADDEVARCGDCSRPLEPEVVEIGRQLCVRCAGPIHRRPTPKDLAEMQVPESEDEDLEGSESESSGSGSEPPAPEPEPIAELRKAKATLVARKEEPKEPEGAKPRAQLTKRKSFEEKAQETASRLEAKLAKFQKDQEEKRIREEVHKMKRRVKEKKKKKKEKKEKKEKDGKLKGKKSK